MIIGKVIDNYKITAVLGRGGMGVVYKAQDMTLDRDVALKMMDSRLASDENFLRRFQSEAKALAKLQNPNIVSVFALRETELGFCIVMEFVEGNTLADCIKENGPMSLDRALPIFKQLLTAFDHAHKAGIIHRDIKPSNVMITPDDVVKVTDFGLAKIQQPTVMTATMGTGGTLFYMSPEQVRGLGNVDSRGDIYSIGMTLYETLAGKVPFSDSDSDFTIRQSIVEGKISTPDRINPDIPREVSRIIMKSIEREAGKRFQSAAEFRDALSAVKVEKRPAIQATSVEPGAALQQNRAGRKRVPLFIAAAVAILAVAGIVLSALFISPGASLSVESEPVGARVFVDGNELGPTPLKQTAVSVGNVELRIDSEGYFTKDTLLALESGQALALSFTLDKVPDPSEQVREKVVPPTKTDERASPGTRPAEQRQSPPIATGTLVLQTVPSGSISVDGVRKANNAVQPISVEADVGDRNVLFEHPQFGLKLLTVDLKAGERKVVTCYFEGYASVGVSGDSQWGTIMVNGSNTNMLAPQAKLPLGVGTHRILVTREGYETVEGEQTVTVAAGFKEAVYPLVFTLKKR